VVLAASLAAAVLVGAAMPARAGEPVVLGCGSAADLKGLIAKLAKLAEKFVPGTGAQVQGMSAMLTQAPEWAGVDWSKPATVVLFGGKAFGKTEPVPVAVVALADAALFRQAHPEGGPVSFEVRGNSAIVAQEKAALPAMTAERFGLYSTFPKIAATADVYLTIYATQAMAEYQAEVDAGLKEFEQNVAQMAMPGPMAMFSKMVKCFGPLLNLAGKQVRRMSLAVEFKDDSVELWSRLYAGEDTELGTFLSGQPAEMTDLAKYLPAEAVMSAAGKLDITKGKPLVEAVLNAIAQPIGLSPDDKQKVRDLMFGSTQTGESAFVFAGGAKAQGMQSVQVARVADPAKYRAASKEAVEWLMKSGFGAFMEAAGVKATVEHKPNVRQHQGVEIDRLTVTTAPAPGAEPNPLMGQQPPQVTEYAATGTVAAAVTNNPTGELLDGVLDRIKGGGTPGFDTSAAWKAALAAAPKGASVVGHFSFNSFMAKAMEEMGKQQPALAMMAGAFFKADPTEEPIASSAAFGANMVDVRVRIPHQPVLALVTRVRMMVEQGMGPGPGRRPGPKPKEQDDF
jgi:hypothetical protein